MLRCALGIIVNISYSNHKEIDDKNTNIFFIPIYYSLLSITAQIKSATNLV